MFRLRFRHAGCPNDLLVMGVHHTFLDKNIFYKNINAKFKEYDKNKPKAEILKGILFCAMKICSGNTMQLYVFDLFVTLFFILFIYLFVLLFFMATLDSKTKKNSLTAIYTPKRI